MITGKRIRGIANRVAARGTDIWFDGSLRPPFVLSGQVRAGLALETGVPCFCWAARYD